MGGVSAGDKKPDSATADVSPIESMLKRRVHFRLEDKPYSPVSSAGRAFHLEILNPDSGSRKPAPSPGGSKAAGKGSGGGEFYEHGLDPVLSLKITFRRIGAGLANLGNTCFLNSVLQCLTYTEPFAAYLRSGKHKSSCRTTGFCAMCALQNHVMVALESTGKILAPSHLVKNLRCISRNFCNSRQEDAHEYMVNLLESMHKCCLPSGVPSESPSAYERSLVHKIFGGRLRSQVKCVQCSYSSNKFDPFLDLSLEIVKADSLNKALTHFTAEEQLDGGQRQYQCQRCKEKVRALKQLTIHKPPYVLAIHLKRFRLDIPGQKIDKKVEFERTLNLSPFVSDAHEGDLKYTLYGVLVHAGWSTHSGHYYCFVRTSSGMWHSLDDNQVIQVNEKTVLAQKAYMLFYVRDRSSVIKRSSHIVRKDINPANTLADKMIPQSTSSLNGSNPNAIAERKTMKLINAQSGQSNSLLESVLKEALEYQRNDNEVDKCPIKLQHEGDQSFSVLNNSSVYPIQKERSTQKSGNNMLKEVPVLSSNDHVCQNKASIIQIEKGTRENGDAANNITWDNVDILKIDSKNVFKKIDTLLVEYQRIDNEVDKCPIKLQHEGDQSISVLNNSSVYPIQKEPSTQKNGNNMLKEVPVLLSNDHVCQNKASIIQIEKGTHENGDAANNITWDNVDILKIDSENVFTKIDTFLVEYQRNDNEVDKCPIKLQHEGDASLLKLKETKLRIIPKKRNTRGVVKFSVPRDLRFGRMKHFLTTLGLRKSKKHKRSKKRYLSARNIIKGEFPDLSPNDLGRSTSESVRIVRDELECLQRKASSTSNIQQSNVIFCYDDDSMKTGERDLHKIINRKEMAVANSYRLKRSSSSSLNGSSSRETDANERVQSQDDLMSLLTRGLKETTVSWWVNSELQLSQIHGSDEAQNGKIGFVLDEFDEEYDKGKRKKLRKHGDSFGGPNQFEETANIKAQQRMKMKIKHSSGDRPFRI